MSTSAPCIVFRPIGVEPNTVALGKEDFALWGVLLLAVIPLIHIHMACIALMILSLLYIYLIPPVMMESLRDEQQSTVKTEQHWPSPIKSVNSNCQGWLTRWLSMKRIYCFFFSHCWWHRQGWIWCCRYTGCIYQHISLSANICILCSSIMLSHGQDDISANTKVRTVTAPKSSPLIPHH